VGTGKLQVVQVGTLQVQIRKLLLSTCLPI
jgi:hypothetical protein